jgi:hypothetical protein
MFDYVHLALLDSTISEADFGPDPVRMIVEANFK